MLKILRAISFVIAGLSLFTSVLIVTFVFKENSKIRAYLQTPDIIESMREKIASIESGKGTVHPLVYQARLVALRIDPPEQPNTSLYDTTDKNGKQDQDDKMRDEIKITTVEQDKGTKQPKSFMFNLLATVRYVSAPEKSLALLQTGGRQEWFRRGQTVGRHEIMEIKDGSVLITQPNQNLQEIFVPPRSGGTNLLKN